MTPRFSVAGGADGIEAHCAELRGTAHDFGVAATEALATSFSLSGYLVHPELVASAALDPIGWARFEDSMSAALGGTGGLGAAGGRCGLLAEELCAAAAAYEGVDRLDTALRPLAGAVCDLPGAVTSGVITELREGSALGGVQAELTDDPYLTDLVAGALYGGVLTGAGPVGGPLTRAALRTLPDGSAGEIDLGVDGGAPARRPPRGVADVVGELARRNEDSHDGAIDVRILTSRDGARHVIVDITGTKDFSPVAGADIADLTSDARAVLGASTSYEQGVLEAMRQAGVRPDDDVMIAGHSLGGAVAVTAARDALASGRFHVSHVLTAGAPIGRTVGALPSSVQVLALENSHDLVPDTDATINPDRVNVTTVRGGYGDTTIGGDHGLSSSYVPMATDVEASADPSIRAYERSARGFFGAEHVTTHTFQIVRRAP